MAITTVTVLKILVPGLAKSILDSIGLESKVANKLLEQTIDVASGGLLEGQPEKANLEKQIQQLAKQFKSEMRPFLEQEARNIDDGGREAIFLAVAETLLRTSLNRQIVDVALDADKLARELLKLDVLGTRGFSQNERSLYEQAIKFISHNLVEMAPQLEGFQFSVTQVMLQRTEEFLAFIRSQIECELQKRDQFLKRYRHAVEQELDKPDKFGVPLLKSTLSEQKLSKAYVQLSITEVGEECEDEDFITHASGDLVIKESMTRNRSRNLEDVLSRRRRLVIRGNAGAGKTSLMSWLAVHAARQDFDDPLQHWNCLIPFFIRLRSRVDDGFPVPEEFVLPIAKNIGKLPENWVQEQLDRGCALVLIDGVDELPQQKRQAFFEDLQRLVSDFPNAVYITTSRPAGLKDKNGEVWAEWEDWMRTEQFSNCVMDPMNLPEIEQFVKRWHEALPEPKRQDDKDPAQMAQDLIRQLKQTPEIRQLASTPLLCTMICALHYTNEGTLPSTRVRLYEKCIEMLLEERDKQRDIKTSIPLKLEQKLGFLKSLAYWLMLNSYSDAEVDKVDRHFDKGIREYALSNVLGKDIRQLLLERSGLLRELVMGRIDFIHRTFQEYLAALAVLDEENIGLLTDKANDDQWREAVIVAVGKGRQRERKEILESLLEKGNNHPENQHYLHFLALSCLETGVAIEPVLRERIETSAKILLPPRGEEGAMIARAGDAVVHLLKYNPAFSNTEIANCIHILVQIGSISAMHQLISYAEAAEAIGSTDILPIRRALGRGYRVFDPKEYAQKVLYHCSSVDLSRMLVKDISILSNFTKLRALYVSGTLLTDISVLSNLTQLKILNLSDTPAMDLSVLSHLKQLRTLNLNDTPVADISMLSNLTHLRALYLRQYSGQFLGWEWSKKLSTV